MTSEPDRLKVLVLSKNYPNRVTELLGLWVERLVGYSSRFCDIKVIAPKPYSPPAWVVPDKYARFRQIEGHEVRNGIEVFRPSMLVGPGYSLYPWESKFYYQ